MTTPAALQAMQLQVEEENVSAIREKEAPVDKVTSVLVEDTEKIISLTSEVEALKVPENNQVLAYWLSNSAMLLRLLLQHEFTSAAIPASRGCMRGGVVSSLDRQKQLVDAKYPATLFTQQLTGFLEKMYVMIRDNFKIEILSLLRLCSQAPHAQENWKIIVQRLSSYLNLMKANNTPPFLYVEAGLAELKRWCIEATDEYVGSAWDELKHIRQAAGFVQAIIQKQEMTLDKITRELCPVLSIRQLYRISSMYFDDIYDMNSVSSDVISSMMIRLIDDLNDGVRSDFLLEDDLSVPFTVEDISNSMEQVDAIIQKQEMTLDKITRELCPVLSIRQLYRISSMYFDDIYDMNSVSSDVISSMMIRLIDDLNDGVRSDFLLEDDLSVPFTVEDISNSMEQVDVNDIVTLSLIHENKSFSFSLTCGEGSSS
ncbi:hypothetical protein Bca4012_011629 [Brassica carinata]